MTPCLLYKKLRSQKLGWETRDKHQFHMCQKTFDLRQCFFCLRIWTHYLINIFTSEQSPVPTFNDWRATDLQLQNEADLWLGPHKLMACVNAWHDKNHTCSKAICTEQRHITICLVVLHQQLWCLHFREGL